MSLLHSDNEKLDGFSQEKKIAMHYGLYLPIWWALMHTSFWEIPRALDFGIKHYVKIPSLFTT